MRVNVYEEELTDRVAIVQKEVDGILYVGLRIYTDWPVTIGSVQYQNRADEDAGAVTLWGRRSLRSLLEKALAALDAVEQPGADT